MASRSVNRRRRRRRSFPWTPIWVCAFIGVTAWGLATSPVTQITSVRVVGAESQDAKRLEGILAAIRGLPALRVPTLDVERLAEGPPAVRSAAFRCNVFGRAVLEMLYREPVAKIEGANIAVDADGVMFPYSKPLPFSFAVNKQVLAPYLSLCAPPRLRWGAQLAKKLQVELPKLGGKLVFDGRNRLCLMTGNLTVVFGGGDRLADKVATLARALQARPELATSRATVNLVEPDHPMQEPTSS
jgi:hypothetical protein